MNVMARNEFLRTVMPICNIPSKVTLSATCVYPASSSELSGTTVETWTALERTNVAMPNLSCIALISATAFIANAVGTLHVATVYVHELLFNSFLFCPIF